jgi:hypothetical protein
LAPGSSPEPGDETLDAFDDEDAEVLRGVSGEAGEQ